MTGKSTKRREKVSRKEEYSVLYTLILHNDDYNHYDYVIDSLVEVCNHNRLQAEQCTLIAHHKGKCDVKTGEFEVLKQMKEELGRRGLSSTINTR
ncbi:MAG TPA: ATP-dependent Clp protease adaptor ClpS [Tenuifilaceae bacterium]|nr:ATP-dependent Clp protease adaptor ClpS [Tenuifilaceae bacterium]